MTREERREKKEEMRVKSARPIVRVRQFFKQAFSRAEVFHRALLVYGSFACITRSFVVTSKGHLSNCTDGAKQIKVLPETQYVNLYDLRNLDKRHCELLLRI